MRRICLVPCLLILFTIVPFGLTGFMQKPSISVKRIQLNEHVDLLTLKPIGVPTSADKEAVFQQVWDDFYKYYPNFQMKGVDWRAERSTYEPKAMRSRSWSAFFGVVENMINTLHDPHCHLNGEPLPPLYSPLVITAWIDHQVVVTWAPKNVSIPIGSIVLGVNDEPLWRFLNKSQLSDLTSYTDNQAMFTSTRRQSEILTLYNPATQKVYKTVVPMVSRSQAQSQLPSGHVLLAAISPFEPGFAYTGMGVSSLDMRLAQLPHGILYAFIPSMIPHQLSLAFRQLLHKAQGEKGLIIDIRGNMGGNMGPGLWFARHANVHAVSPVSVRFPISSHALLPSDVLVTDKQLIPLIPEVTEKSQNTFTPWGRMLITPLSPHISIPIAVLINGLDGSSSENFTVFMQSAPNVETFGSRTAGSDGSPVSYPVMRGVSVSVSS